MNELIVDSFAGGGGASTGIEWAIGRSPDIAINHSPEAIEMHRLNHPATKHFCENVWKVDPLEATGGQPVGLAWFSPDCTHFSKAKGGKPRSKKIRGLAWVVYHWAKAVRPRVIMLENVEEFADWGPLLEDGRPCPLRRGMTFRRWWRQLENLGYQLDARELRACDYGAPTSRKRLFIIARRDGLPIRWPDETNGPGRAPYRTAGECIDWTVPCTSIFDRKRPLAEATMKRIAAGVMKYVVNARQPYLVMTIDHQSSLHATRSTSEPASTITTKARHALVAAFLARHFTGVIGRGLNEPTPTITATDHHSLVTAKLALDKREQVAAFLTAYYGNEKMGRSLAEPMGTIVSKDRFGLVTVRGATHYIADIGLRMLTPRELFRAQGFPESIQLLGSQVSQVRLCGNSVSPPLAAAIVRANMVENVQEVAA